MIEEFSSGSAVDLAGEDPAYAAGGAAFPIVGIGASAGGLVALKELLGAVPADTGLAFVVVQHLAPEHESSLAEILSRATTLPVREVVNELKIEPDHVYVIPPGRDMIVKGGKLLLLPQPRQTSYRGIDRFFRSLAADSAHLSIGVVLSGALNDGTVGLEEIKAAGGVTFAQDDSAQHESMPRSAVASGCVDFIQSPADIARELAHVARHSYIADIAKKDDVADPEHGAIMDIVREVTGVDFTHYKATTLGRRIARRMMLHRLNATKAYEAHLRRSPDEIEALFQDLLISVTSFFRDPHAFELLEREVFPRLIAACPPGDVVRLWVAGCSSGEEAYSLAMVFTECAEAAGSTARLHLFATDVNPRCIEKARAGWYPRTIAQEVSPERLRRFFTEESGGYRVRKALREHCVFSRHNLLSDPPFSRVDLIACRNLLIYLEGVLQQRVMQVFHYALRPKGFLWLGISESVGAASTLFEAVDLRNKTFTRRPGGAPTPVMRAISRTADPNSSKASGLRQPGPGELHRDAERWLLAKYAPPGVVVSTSLEIVRFQGDTSPYLAPTSGAASHHLLKMLREGLVEGVREALQRAGELGQPVSAEGLQVRDGDGFRTLSVDVIPLPSDSNGGGGFMVLFDPRGRPAAPVRLASRVGGWLGRLVPARRSAGVTRDEEIARLTRELEATRQSLEAVSEQHEAVTEELRSANEEAQSSNEEMQSVNEELETSKEELEATNEELATLNDELAQRNAELSGLMEDLRAARDYSESIVANARVPLLVLDSALVVKSANRAFCQRFQVAPGKTEGLRIYDLGNRQWDIPGLRTMLDEVMSRKRAVEDYEVRHDFETIGHRVMLLNADLLPQGEGLEPLITLSIEDITDRALADETRARLAAIVESSDAAIVGTNLDGIITSWNRGAGKLFGYTADEIVDRPVTVLIPEDRQSEELRIISNVRSGTPIEHFETVRRRKDGSLFHVSLTTSPIIDDHGKLVGVSKIARDITARKQVEQALRESEARYRAIGESIDYGVWVCDAEGRNTYASDSFLDLVGLTQEQCSNFGWSNVLHPDDAVRTVEAWKECVKAGGVWDIEHQFRGVDGNWHPVLARGVPVKNDRGEVISWVGINLDVSRQKNAERALEESGRRFRLMANAISQLAWTARADGYLEWYNERWYEYTGTTPEAMEGWGWQAVHDPAELPRVMEQWKAAIASGVSFDMTFPLRGADGTYRLFLTRGIPIKNEAGEVTQWFGTNTDIDDLKRAEAALRKSEEFTRSIVESSPDCIKVLDLDGNLLSLEAGLELLGIPDFTPYLGTSWLDFWLREEDRAAARDTLAAARSGVEGQFVGFYRTEDGRDRWWSVAISPVFGPGNTPVRVLAVSRDVTAQRDMEQMLVARAEALAEADRAKDEFLAMLAHELRNPLASLHHAAEVLNAPGSGEAQRDHARLVLSRQIGNMSRMIDDLLDVSRITEGKIELNKCFVDLHCVLNAAANLARSSIASRGQTITLKFPDAMVHLEADATRLEQVFGNLLTNACKYSGEGCHIEIEAQLAEREVMVTVRDDGEGIAPDLLPRIFELFVQSSRTLDRAHGGLGIGLTLVRRLVKLHGGSVEARSAGIGLGSEFIVRLPWVASTPGAPPQAAASPAGGVHPSRMLIVDDNVDAAQSLAMLQELLGHTTRIAHTGPAGLAFAAEFVPQVVLLDIGLPGMDGYEVARQLRRIPALEKVIIFGMSGYGRPEDRTRAMLAGFDEYFVKPVDLDELREAIRARGGP